MTLMLRYAARSDVGLIRESNQDSVYAGPRLLAVADGMGGQAAGDVASRVVIATLSHLDDDAPGGDLVDALRRATRAANELLHDMVEGDPALDGMGTTLTAILFAGTRLGLVHVGDSRAYLYRGGRLAQITHDDTFVQSLVDEGRISADEASSHPQRSLLLRALTGSEVDPDYSVREAVEGDRYLLCSDGLSGVVSQDTLAEALALATPEEAADRLVELALRGGGPDNVTVIVADIVEGSYGDDEPVLAGAVAAGSAHDAGPRPPSRNSAAGRAALARPVREEPDAEPVVQSHDPPRRGRWVLAGVVALALIAVGGWLGWRYVQSQYYVAASEDGTVSVFRGVRGSVAGVSLHSVQHRSDLQIDDLKPFARRHVNDGIPAANRADAEQIVTRLQTQLLPECPTPQSSASPSPAKSASPSPRTSATPTPSPAQSADAAGNGAPGLTPGEDCREPHP